jgi:hypothetical protein
LNSGTSYVFKKVSTQTEVDALKEQAINLTGQKVPEAPRAALGRANKFEQEVNGLLRERGFAKDVSEEIAASIIAKAQDFVRNARKE